MYQTMKFVPAFALFIPNPSGHCNSKQIDAGNYSFLLIKPWMLSGMQKTAWSCRPTPLPLTVQSWGQEWLVVSWVCPYSVSPCLASHSFLCTCLGFRLLDERNIRCDWCRADQITNTDNSILPLLLKFWEKHSWIPMLQGLGKSCVHRDGVNSAQTIHSTGSTNKTLTRINKLSSIQSRICQILEPTNESKLHLFFLCCKPDWSDHSKQLWGETSRGGKVHNNMLR